MLIPGRETQLLTGSIAGMIGPQQPRKRKKGGVPDRTEAHSETPSWCSPCGVERRRGGVGGALGLRLPSMGTLFVNYNAAVSAPAGQPEGETFRLTLARVW